MDKLTPKQEMFVQGIISGLSQRQAYRQAFPNSQKWKDNAVDSAASRLLQNSKVLARYRELLKQFSNMSLWSREQAFNEYEWLKNKARASIEQEGIRQANSNAFLAALDGMNNTAFKDLELEDKKLLLEIEKLASQVGDSEGQDEKIADFIEMLKGAIIDDN
ncbi:TPA: terminase small subunit [Streptococcus suis]